MAPVYRSIHRSEPILALLSAQIVRQEVDLSLLASYPSCISVRCLKAVGNSVSLIRGDCLSCCALHTYTPHAGR